MLQHYLDERRRLARQIVELLAAQAETRPTASRMPERLAEVRRREQQLLAWSHAVLDPVTADELVRLEGGAL